MNEQLRAAAGATPPVPPAPIQAAVLEEESEEYASPKDLAIAHATRVEHE